MSLPSWLALHDRLLKRELGNRSRYSHVRGLYGSKNWAESLDIVNELDGHTGCVNALSWSRSGKLLASGSDDTHVHIHSYLPQDGTSQFNLAASISTGHTQNIFSVKFMPHSNDRTLVSVAGDATVRIFDVEYSTTVSGPDNSPTRPRSGGASVWANTRHLSYADTNSKVFRSHSERVKRIVTESSPFFFLTCSEDGDVRQWDLREPESSYPTSVSGSLRYGPLPTYRTDVPPPLISYRRYNIDLNTISCSPSRPHYIALGGSHLHCFLHDRRMLGRDRAAERGSTTAANRSSRDEELMSQATQCVRRFAPNGQPRMGRTDSGHITACKISDADPNNLIASWSGDHIYSFNIVQSPDARDETSRDKTSATISAANNGSSENSFGRKRKRVKEGSTLSLEATARADSRARNSNEPVQQSHDDLALRVNYGNGQREEIPIEPSRSQALVPEEAEANMSESERRSFLMARASVRLRKAIFSPRALGDDAESSSVLARYHESFSVALTLASKLLIDVEDSIRTWRYPVNPPPVDLVYQRSIRRDRERTARFIQATGTLARVLGGRIRTAGGANAEAAKLEPFVQIRPAPNEQSPLARKEHFGYDFLKAICLWLDSGPGALVRGFSRRNIGSRFPLRPSEDGDEPSIDAIDEQLIPYLLRLASDNPILNIDASEFELDESRIAFQTEKAAVLAFAQAIKVPFQDLTTGAILPACPSTSQRAAAQDRSAAFRFWGFKIGRGVLINAAEGVDFRCVDHAFGGLGHMNDDIKADERRLARISQSIDTSVEEDEVQSVALLSRATNTIDEENEQHETTNDDAEHESHGNSREVTIPMDVLRNLMTEELDIEEVIDLEQQDDHEDEEGEEEEMQEGSTDEGFEDDSSVEEELEVDEDDDDDDEDNERTHTLFQAYNNNGHRSKANVHVPVSSHTRSYAGHCNIKTVKDVNFWGLQDEYVVSGSDSGHLFIWDSKSTRLINILEGDGEVVNVIQGHPYEPLLAVSGIDHTIKVFSPDARARRDARLGVGVKKVDESGFSSIQSFGLRRRRPRSRPSDALGTAESNLPTTIDEAEAQATAERQSWADADDAQDSEEEDGRGGGPPVAPGGLQSKKRMWDEYRILSANDSDRQGNNRGDYISVSDILSFFLGLA